MKTVSITDYKLLTPKLARVIISTTGNPTKSQIEDTISQKATGTFSVVKGSFRKIQEGVAVGYVKANREIRALTDKTQYRTFASAANVMMDKADESLWAVKSGDSGKYLVRQTNEDLSTLVAATVHRRTDIPGLRHLTTASATESDMVVYVDEEGEISGGYATATNANTVRIVDANTKQPMSVSYDQVIGIVSMPVQASVHKKVLAALTDAQKDNMVAYYTQLYSYAPDYLAKVLQNIEETAVA